LSQNFAVIRLIPAVKLLQCNIGDRSVQVEAQKSSVAEGRVLPVLTRFEWRHSGKGGQRRPVASWYWQGVKSAFAHAVRQCNCATPQKPDSVAEAE
jgi:hypothetical protein